VPNDVPNEQRSSSPSPDPAVTPGLEPGAGVPSGETPPSSDQMSGASGDAQQAPNMGPVSGNRTPMVVTLVLLALAVLAIAVITGASFFPS
jgi:hypothetical protein